MNDAHSKPEDKNDGKGVARSFVSADKPGSEFETSELPAVPDDSDDETESIHGVVVDSSNPGSMHDTSVIDKSDIAPPKPDPEEESPKADKAAEPATEANSENTGEQQEEESESIHGFVVDPARPGSSDETYVGRVDEFETVNDADETDDEDATAMVQKRKDPFDDLETREVPALKDEWRERAAKVADDAAIVSDWAGEDGSSDDPSLAASVAAASGEVPLPGEEPPASIAGPVLTKARAAQANWARLRFEQRMPLLDALRGELVAQRADYVPSLATAIGRPMVEALVGEYVPVLEALRTLDELVPPLLVEQHSASSPSTHEGVTSVVRPTPYGVVLIVNGPSAPFGLPMTLAIDALATGNAVLICGSEYHPRINETMRRLFARAGFPEGLIQVVGGDSETLDVLIEARPDKVIFDGETDAAARAAAHSAEVGADFQVLRRVKDLAIVLKSADMAHAIAGIMSAAYAGGGIRHGAIERVVVADALYDEFRMLFIDAIRTMNSHHAQLANIGDNYNPRRAHLLIEDAIAHGARVTYPSGEEPGRWIHWKAAVFEAVPPRAKLSTQRFEGPGCALYRAENPMEEAAGLLELMPAANISVFGAPGRDEQARLEELPCARIAFNDVLLTGGATGTTPLGPDTPRSQCGPASMLRPRLITIAEPARRRVGWFPYTDDKAYALMDAMEAVYGIEAGKRLKAMLRLAVNPSKRRLLKGDD